jgi:hypothetical protein
VTHRVIMALSLLITCLAYALAAGAIVIVNYERRECERLHGGPVATQWSIARGCIAEFYPGIHAPIGRRPAWLRLP